MTNILGYSWLWGLSGAISTLGAQDWGAQRYEAVGITLQRGILILFCFADLQLILVWLNSEHIMVSAGQPPDVAAYVGLYTTIRVPGILCETLSTSFGRSLGSIGNTRIGFKVSLVMMVVNITASLVLIPKFGFKGSAITATLCDVVGASMTCIFAFRDPDFLKTWSGFDRRAWDDWPAFLKISFPSFILLASEAW